MLKKFSCSALLLPVAIVLHGALTAVEFIMLRAGTGSLDNHNHQPTWPSWYAVIIDTDQVVLPSNRAGTNGAHGLPDPYDSGKPKDFYAIYPSLYCSGMKNGRAYETDSCSPWGRPFDLQWLWRDAGVDLVRDDYIGYRPRTIFFSIMTGASGTALSLISSFVGLFSFWGKVASCVLSWISFAALIANAVTSQQFVSRLVANVHSVQPTSGTGALSADSGPIHTRVSWVMVFTALADALLVTFIVWRHYRRRRENAKNGGGGGGGGFRGRLGGVYQHLAPGGKEAGRGMHGGSRVELIPRGASPAGRKGAGGVTAQASAYEPMRHRGV